MSTPLFASEREFGDSLADVAKSLGWHVAHFRPARTEDGWRTAMQGHPGFVDFVLARAGVVLFWELKMPGNKPTPNQTAWIAALGGPSDTVRVLYPQDYDWAVRMLAEGARC